MSGHWASKEAVHLFHFPAINFLMHNYIQDKIAKDTSTHGAMLVPVIAGSNKMTVSVATGHQEYHPVYISMGNISNTVHHAHGNGVIPVAFLPIPKGLPLFIFVTTITTHFQLS
jgi:Plavaka transposase